LRYVPSYLVFDEHGDLVRRIVPDQVTPLANGYRVLDDQGKVVSRLMRIEPDALVDIARGGGGRHMRGAAVIDALLKSSAPCISGKPRGPRPRRTASGESL